jgi:hypothetical protein
MRRFASIALFLSLGVVAGCSRRLPQGQFGTYARRPEQLVLSATDTLAVYRIKLWIFNTGEPPALQLEYEPPFSVADTAAVHREARRLWPVFAPYAEARHLTAAIVTATNLHVLGLWPIAWTSHVKSFGLVATRSTDGRWYFDGDSAPLPSPDPSGIPRIMDANGRPEAFEATAPTGL